MDWSEAMLWTAGGMIVLAPFLTWHFGLTGVRYGFVGLAILGLALLYALTQDARAGPMFLVWLAAFSYHGIFALIVHADGSILSRGSPQ